MIALSTLLDPWPELSIVGDAARPVRAVVEDSRAVTADSLFVAVDGHGADGHAYIPQAIEAGATVIVVDADRLDEVRAASLSERLVTWVTASCTRGLPARLARECEGRPDAELSVVGVTGTNGKTTSAFLLQALLGRLRGRCGLLGTIRYDDGRTQAKAPLTTPGGPMLYRWLARMREAGCTAAAMEISSHALDQERVADLALDAALLTNLGRDHLDYHGSLAAYAAAKRSIVDRLGGDRRGRPPGVAVVPADDPVLGDVTNPHGEHVTFAVGQDAPGADLKLQDAAFSLAGTRLKLTWRGRSLMVASPLVGRFNAANLTAALAVGLALGLDPTDAASALADVAQVPGRMERFELPSGAIAVVDYAHTHDALAAVLRTSDELSTGRLSVVFGAGGDRDQGKRPLMGGVAAERADHVWITSDNPRGEEPAQICAAIAAGFDAVDQRRATRREVVVDRTTAIRSALAEARDGDVVVIAGKGHEDYQIVGDRVLHLDDREIVRAWIDGASDDG